MKKDTLVCESTVQSHMDFIIDCIEIPCPDANIVFYIAGFIAKSLTKKFKCKGCINVLGRTKDVLMPELENIPENCQYFIDRINRGGQIKPSDIIYLTSIASCELYKLIMDNSDSKSYFLSCKLQRPVFSKCLKWYVENKGKYNAVLDMKCTDNHSFEVILQNVGEKFFNSMAKNFVNDINSITHSQKKRGSKTKLSSASSKIRKLVSNMNTLFTVIFFMDSTFV